MDLHPDPNSLLSAASQVAAAAIFLRGAIRSEQPGLTEFQWEALAVHAGANLRAALDVLVAHLPGIRAKAAAGVSTEAMLSEYDNHMAPREQDADLLRALLPVAIVAEGILATADAGTPKRIWEFLEERLDTLELSEPVIHSQLASEVERWISSASHELPKDDPLD